MKLERDSTPREREHKKRVDDDRDRVVKKMYGEKIDPHKKPYSNFNIHKEDKEKGKVQWYWSTKERKIKDGLLPPPLPKEGISGSTINIVILPNEFKPKPG